MTLRSYVLAALALTVATTATRGALAADPVVNGESLTQTTRRDGPSEQFGRKGQLAISSDAALTISSTSYSGQSGSTTKIQLDPAVDYFVAESLSIGGSVLLDYSSAGNGHATDFGIGPRVGYNWTLSDLISIWPKAGLSIVHHNVTSDTPVAVGGTVVTGSTSASNTSVALNLYVPFMLHPAPHFFTGFGPFLDTDLSGDVKATTFGGKLTIGGWFFGN